MKRHTITLGARTTSGGKVISASSNGDINSAPIALENDLILCPACRSQGKILCVGPRIPELWDGKQVAMENDLCVCGCFPSPRLLANQSLKCQVVGISSTSGSAAGSESLWNRPENPRRENDEYDLEFLLTDETTGAAAVDWPYVIELANGLHLEGRTDHDGKTAKVSAQFAEHAILRVFPREHAPINPHWDQ